MLVKNLHLHFVHRMRLGMGLIVFSIFLFPTLIVAQSQPSISFDELYIAAEVNGKLEASAKALAMGQEKPLSIYIKDEVLIEAKDIENDEPVYIIYHNFTDPKQDGEVAFYSEIESRFDLDNARINMGNGVIIDPYQNETIAERIPTPDASLGILLIPDSNNDRIMAFNRETGDLIDANYIPTFAGFSTPLAARPNHTKSGNIFISDMIEDVVKEFTSSGVFVQDFVPMGGANNAILDNVRGIEFKAGTPGHILVANADGSNADAIVEFNTNGVFLGNFIPNTISPMDSPFDIVFFETRNTYLISAVNSTAIHEFDIDGNYLGEFAAIAQFPEQLLELPNGNVLVANFIGIQEGILEYNAAGGLVGVYDDPVLGGYRGVYELANGNLLVTNSAGVHEMDKTGTLVETKIAGVSARFIHEYNFEPVVDPNAGPSAIPTMGEWALFFFALMMLTLGLVYAYNYQTQLALVTAKGKKVQTSSFSIPFDKKAFLDVVPVSLLLVLVGFGFIQLVWGEIIVDDIVGMILVLPLINYLGHFWKITK